jgi:site-specific DNA-methyltransferase (adenine-specific)/modification methylase
MNFDYIENGDCLKLMKELPDKCVDVAFTSPPYNRKRNDKYSFYDDTISDYYGFLLSTIENLRRIVKRHIILNVQTNYYNKKDIYRLIGTYADHIQNIIIWEKTNPMPASGTNITNAFEYFFVIGDKPLKANGTYVKNIISTSVNSNMPKEHKAVMKKEVCDWFIKQFTNENDIVIDPFLGTGTTAVSCIEQGRHYIGFELEPKYFDICCKRLDDVEKTLDNRSVRRV